MSFEEHKTKCNDKSSVWYYFLMQSKGAPQEKCKICKRVLKTNLKNNLPFSLFVTSTELRKSLKARGFEVPKSRETIKAKFMEYFIKCKNDMKKEIVKLKSNLASNFTYFSQTIKRNCIKTDTLYIPNHKSY